MEPNLEDVVTLLDPIGEGIYGEVYLAEDKEGERYAAKISLSRYENGSIRQEAGFLAKVSQEPNSPFLRYYGLYRYYDRLAILMEYFPGSSLSAFSTDLLLNDSHFLALEILSQLMFLHERNWIHGDIHPNNILYSPEEERVVLIDMDGTSKVNALQLGLSPEQWEQIKDWDLVELQKMKDIFDFGLVMRWILLDIPWNSLIKYEEDLDLRVEYPEIKALEELVNWCLDPDPFERPTAEQLLAMIK